ncbi:carboxymuconolactone decarboxylase family protein [Calditrichota bacterium]
MSESTNIPEIREVILTSYLFDGYPSALEGFRLLSDLELRHSCLRKSSEAHSQRLSGTHSGETSSDSAACDQVSPPDRSKLNYTPANLSLWRSRGVPLYRQIYGDQADKLQARVQAFAPELADAMLVEGYGKVLSRDALDIATRELCIVTMLAVKDKPRQLLSHALGALRVGATSERLLAIPDHIADFLTTDPTPILQTAISK